MKSRKVDFVRDPDKSLIKFVARTYVAIIEYLVLAPFKLGRKVVNAARMTILRRRLFQLWMLCSILWVAFFVVQVAPRVRGDEVLSALLAAVLPPIILLVAGLGVVRFGEPHWMRLPEHLRKGLWRLYIAVTVPWVAWFAYQILEGFRRPYYLQSRYVMPAFWSLLIVPIGAPILFLVIAWVVAGFQKSAPSTEAAAAQRLENGLVSRSLIFLELERPSERSS